MKVSRSRLAEAAANWTRRPERSPLAARGMSEAKYVKTVQPGIRPIPVVVRNRAGRMPARAAV
jgi:hypothetical protein